MNRIALSTDKEVDDEQSPIPMMLAEIPSSTCSTQENEEEALKMPESSQSSEKWVLISTGDKISSATKDA